MDLNYSTKTPSLKDKDRLHHVIREFVNTFRAFFASNRTIVFLSDYIDIENGKVSFGFHNYEKYQFSTDHFMTQLSRYIEFMTNFKVTNRSIRMVEFDDEYIYAVQLWVAMSGDDTKEVAPTNSERIDKLEQVKSDLDKAKIKVLNTAQQTTVMKNKVDKLKDLQVSLNEVINDSIEEIDSIIEETETTIAELLSKSHIHIG